MRYYETHYEEYLKSSRQVDIHPELADTVTKMPSAIDKLGNLILYGPPGSGKYTQFLRFIESYSPSRLKYDKKIQAQTEKHTYNYRISDIHYEIDLSLLGCESKRMWNECFFQIVDIVSMKPDKSGIILCKNFHAIHSELLDVFYSYMQHANTLNIHLVFFLITDHVSFIPNNIAQHCKIVRVKRPDANYYTHFIESGACQQSILQSSATKSDQFIAKVSRQNTVKRTMGKPGVLYRGMELGSLSPESFLNLKDTQYMSLVSDPEKIPKDVFNIVCDNIIREMESANKLEYTVFRDQLYDILLYGLDVTDCLWYVVYHFVQKGKLTNLSPVLSKIHTFLKYYNNNYRPIYHLESIFLYIITSL
jgi:hypothetical protein